jgi:thiamine biosynthesis protein ThiI
MGLVEHVIATVHEVALKGGNRGWFERTLLANVRRALTGFPVAEVSIPARVVIRFAEPVPWSAAFERLGTVFGMNGIIPVERVGTTYEQLECFVGEHLDRLMTAAVVVPGRGPKQSHLEGAPTDSRSGAPTDSQTLLSVGAASSRDPNNPAAPATSRSFAVRCKRSDKRFPLTSEEINRKLGAFVATASGLGVDLETPDVTLHVLVQNDGIYLFHRRFPGPGGLPVGTSGRVLVLLSGGIDSPVAAYMAMKRGTKAHYVHFHSAPYTSDASVGKVERLVEVLIRHQGAARLAVVPFGDCQREIVASCPERMRVLLYRRMMLRTAERIARRWRCEALVTGDSLNQVASQTLENLAAIDRVAHMPVLRPLVCLDKQEIIDIAERAETFELSILPHQDCCSFLQPRHPATRSTAAECEAAEASLDVEGWARRLQHEATTSVKRHTWGMAPVASG